MDRIIDILGAQIAAKGFDLDILLNLLIPSRASKFISLPKQLPRRLIKQFFDVSVPARRGPDLLKIL